MDSREASPSSFQGNSIPILAISVLGILTISALLLAYYIFVLKCCVAWRRRHHHDEELLPVYYSTGAVERRTFGLSELAIREIPTVIYGGAVGVPKARSFHECAVCLNEFQEEEKIRMLPNCFHLFHIDCVDTWLQSNSNCPLCRSAITAAPKFTAHRIPGVHDDAAIEVRECGAADVDQNRYVLSRTEHHGIKEERKLCHSISLGDERVAAGKNGEQTVLAEPVRRSFSMDCSSIDIDRHVVAVDLQEKAGEGCSSGNSGRIWRSFVSFGRASSKISRPVLPPQSDQFGRVKHNELHAQNSLRISNVI